MLLKLELHTLNLQECGSQMGMGYFINFIIFINVVTILVYFSTKCYCFYFNFLTFYCSFMSIRNFLMFLILFLLITFTNFIFIIQFLYSFNKNQGKKSKNYQKKNNQALGFSKKIKMIILIIFSFFLISLLPYCFKNPYAYF